MKNGPRILFAAGSALLAVVFWAGAGGCGQMGGPGGSGIEVEDGSLRGELAVYIADGLEGQSETRYALRSPSGVERSLLFDSEVKLEPGAQLKVWGTDSPDGIRVTSYEQTSPAIEQTTSALLNGTAFAPRTFAFVLLDLGAGTGTVTPTSIMGTLITNPESIRNYYINDSYGLQDISAQVFSLSYTFPATCASADTSALATALRPMITTMGGTFNHYLWYLGTRRTQCAWAGLASVGTAQTPSRDTWYNASTSCVVLVQEPGHNFGMQHSSSLTCAGASFADDPNTCTTSEYGDSFDPMGGGCRHMNAWQKSYQGWFGGCNGVAVTNTGTFTLLPFENRCNGAQFLKVKAAKVRTFNRPAAGGGGASTENMAFYYVELRTPVDFDGMLGNRTALTPQVLIHAGDDVRTRTQRGVHTYLLDMTPTTTSFADAALKAGSTFMDPAGGISITATAVSATQATIDVAVTGGTGDPTCLDGTTFVNPGPGPESCGPGSVGGASGSGGAAGTGGVTGTGGMTGAGGRGGSAAGTGGRGGTTGAGGGVNPGSGGNSGTGGLIGAGGRGPGTGGNAAGSGGSGAPNSGGAPGSTGGAGPGANAHPDVSSGCACSAEGPAHSTSWSGSLIAMIALIFFGSVRSRSRRRR